jgi:hypothetical protein
MRIFVLVIVFSALTYQLYAQKRGIEVFRMKKTLETHQVNKMSFSPVENIHENQYKYKAKQSSGFSFSSVKLFFPAKNETLQTPTGSFKPQWALFKADTMVFFRNQNTVMSCLRYGKKTRYAASSILKWAGNHSVYILKTVDFPELKSVNISK